MQSRCMVTSVWKTSVCFIGPHWQVHDMRRTKPTLFHVLQLCITEEEGKDIVTALIGGVILKQHNERMTFLQRLFSILLSSNYSPKQVLLHNYNCWLLFLFQLFRKLQKFGVCMSHKSTKRYIDILCSNFDELVMNWKREISDMIWSV